MKTSDVVKFGAAAALTACAMIASNADAAYGATGTSIHRTVSAGSFVVTGSSPTNYVTMTASLPSDSWYGFRSSVAPTAYVDYKPASGSYGYSHQICHYSFTGTTVACGTTSTGTVTTTYADVSTSVLGTYGLSNNIWDYYTLTTTMTGAASTAAGITGVGLHVGPGGGCDM
jgi:hypothetical protein